MEYLDTVLRFGNTIIVPTPGNHLSAEGQGGGTDCRGHGPPRMSGVRRSGTGLNIHRSDFVVPYFDASGTCHECQRDRSEHNAND